MDSPERGGGEDAGVVRPDRGGMSDQLLCEGERSLPDESCSCCCRLTCPLALAAVRYEKFSLVSWFNERGLDEITPDRGCIGVWGAESDRGGMGVV